MTTIWDPRQYSRFSEERSRPFFDLVARVEMDRVRSAVDLGCGSGRLTRTLLERWPDAQILGVDRSQEMLARARPHEDVGGGGGSGSLRFLQADVATWQAPSTFDLVLSNAALHWLPDHRRLIPRLASMVSPGGALAVQMPYNFDEPSHRVIAEALNHARWQGRLRDLAQRPVHVQPLPWYGERLRRLGFSVDAWETTYLHVLKGSDPVLEWVRGTALRPALSRLSPEEQQELLDDLAPRLRRAYPPESAGEGVMGTARGDDDESMAGDPGRPVREDEAALTVLPFRRVFFVARLPQD